jgi:hypothetical protein
VDNVETRDHLLSITGQPHALETLAMVFEAAAGVVSDMAVREWWKEGTRGKEGIYPTQKEVKSPSKDDADETASWITHLSPLQTCKDINDRYLISDPWVFCAMLLEFQKPPVRY